MINGAFTIIFYNGTFLFLKRKDKLLWDLPGGGFESDEVDYKSVAIREAKEEAGIDLVREKLHLFAILGQRLRQEAIQKHQVSRGFLFLHYTILHTAPVITIDPIAGEHSEYRFFTQQEIITRYTEFSSGPLWSFFTYLAFLETQKIQEGMLRDRATWLGKTYVA